MNKRKKKNKRKKNKLLIIILLLLFFSYFELTSDIRLGGLIRDVIFYPTRNIEEHKLLNSLTEEYKSENKELKDLIDINYSLKDFDIKYATVIERNNSYWLNEVTINKGKVDGIDKNYIVVTENGLVGIVISSSFLTSKVKLITNSNSYISVKINNKNKVLSNKNNELIVKGINEKDNIRKEDRVITSGLSDLYPEGLLIGTIKAIYKESDGVGYYAEVKPSQDLNNLRFVALIKRIIQ